MKTNQRPPCYIQRIGTAVPEQSINQEQTVELLKKGCINRRSEKLLQRIVRLTGIRKRHLVALDHQFGADSSDGFYQPPSKQPNGPGMGARSALFEKVSGPLVLKALNEFPEAHLAKIDALVTVSCTHASSPGLEKPIFLHTPVPTSAHRWHLGFMGCSAALAAMRLIHQTASCGNESLIVACELSSLHFQYTDALDQMTANLLFADGAAAMTISSQPSAVRIIDCRSVAVPDYADQMVWFAGDHGLQLELSKDLPETLANLLPSAISKFLEGNDTSIKAIDHWLVHPGGPQILDSVQQALALSENALQCSRTVLRHYGNMSSPTILFIMNQHLETKVDGTVVAMAFGPGLTIELVLMEVDHTIL